MHQPLLSTLQLLAPAPCAVSAFVHDLDPLVQAVHAHYLDYGDLEVNDMVGASSDLSSDSPSTRLKAANDGGMWLARALFGFGWLPTRVETSVRFSSQPLCVCVGGGGSGTL